MHYWTVKQKKSMQNLHIVFSAVLVMSEVLVHLQSAKIARIYRCFCKECYFVKDALLRLLTTAKNETKQETSKTETNSGIATFI